ncbi:MAG: crossover junction endodeoxyribonuclease RuvC [Legionellales bacterium]|nr:crossover junction endodeoxyribonuclease RuvC [Legionellales bacterium]
MKEDIILGIDPGSRITGYGVIGRRGQKLHYIASGCIKTQEGEHYQRLDQVYTGINHIIAQYQPTLAAIEDIFFHRNPRSALKLGQARGVALLALARAGLTIHEYPARQIKQAVVGYGNAEKKQMQHMVSVLLNLNGQPQADAADALAVAICCAHLVRIFC